MDKKRIRKTLNDAVERYLLGDVDGDFRFNYIWIRSQLSFAFSIDAITIDEFDALSSVVLHAYKTDRRGPECVDFPRLSQSRNKMKPVWRYAGPWPCMTSAVWMFFNIISPAWNIFWLTWTKRRIPSRPYPVRSRQHSLFFGVSFSGSAPDYI